MLQWLPVTLRVKTNYPNIIYKSLQSFASSYPLQPYLIPFPPFSGLATGLLAPLTTEPVYILVNCYSSFSSQIKFDFLRWAFLLFLQALPALPSSSLDLSVAVLHVCVVVQQVFTECLFCARHWLTALKRLKFLPSCILHLSEVN